MRAGDRNRGLLLRKHSEQLRSLDDRDIPFDGSGDFGIVLDGGGDHHQIGSGRMCGVSMAPLDFDSAGSQLLGLGVGTRIRAGDDIALLVQDRRQSAHADPADTDEMHRAGGAGSVILVMRPMRPVRFATASRNLSPRSNSSRNSPNDAHPGERITTSPALPGRANLDRLVHGVEWAEPVSSRRSNRLHRRGVAVRRAE